MKNFACEGVNIQLAEGTELFTNFLTGLQRMARTIQLCLGKAVEVKWTDHQYGRVERRFLWLIKAGKTI